MSKTTVIYNDIAPGSDYASTVTSEDAQPVSKLAKLPFGVAKVPIITGEHNAFLLGGTFRTAETEVIPFWSKEMSGDDCVLTNAPQITVSLDAQFSSVGITIIGDLYDYCTSVNIKWYRGTTLLSNKDFTPNSTTYFCENRVENFDKVVLTFRKTSLPRRYAKINRILFGMIRKFGMADLRKARITNEMNLASVELPISKFSWKLDSKEDVAYMFQLKQPVEAWNDDRLIGVYYIDEYSRTADHIYPIECYDAIGVLSETAFPGGVYSGKSAKALAREIVYPFNVEFGADVVDTNLTGVIKSGKSRDALQQVLFAWGVCAATDGSEAIRVFNIPAEEKEIPADKTFLGVSVSTAAIVTEVQVVSHVFTESENGSVEIGGKKYSDATETYTVKNPNVTANTKQNVKKISDATLVSPSIAQSVAQRVYDYYARRNTNSATIVYTGEKLGELKKIHNSWGGTNSGNIEKMEIKLSNTVVYGCEAKGV